MKLTLSLKGSYLTLALLTLFLIILGLGNPFGNEISRSFYFGLSTELTGAILIIFLVDRIIARNQEEETTRRRTIALRGLRFALRQHLALLVAMFKASVSKQPERDYRTPSDLFDDYYVEQVGFLDFAKKAPVLPDMRWYEYLASECGRFKEQVNLTLTKFSTDIDPDLLDVLEELVNSPFLSFIIQAPAINVIDQRLGFARSQNLFMGLGPIVKDYVNAFSKLLELYNANVADMDRVSLPPGIWRNDVAPKLGDSRVALIS